MCGFTFPAPHSRRNAVSSAAAAGPTFMLLTISKYGIFTSSGRANFYFGEFDLSILGLKEGFTSISSLSTILRK